LRLSAFVGFFSAMLSFLVALGYLIYKLIYWYDFSVGIAPMVIGVFFFLFSSIIFYRDYWRIILVQFTHNKKTPFSN